MIAATLKLLSGREALSRFHRLLQLAKQLAKRRPSGTGARFLLLHDSVADTSLPGCPPSDFVSDGDMLLNGEAPRPFHYAAQELWMGGNNNFARNAYDCD